MIYAILANREKTRPDVLQRLLIEKTDKLEKLNQDWYLLTSIKTKYGD
jgi:hypothetical protein